MPAWKEEYEHYLKDAINHFWRTRSRQTRTQRSRNVSDTGARGAVTGGKQMDGFLLAMRKIALDIGVPENCIFTRGNELPGYFRATKEWDFLIISPKKQLVSCIEFKSQVGSFGNNFNNRTEEALGSSVDIHTAFREKAFGNQESPWLGYFMVVEKATKSTSPIGVKEPHFKVFDEFRDTSYIKRYDIFCKRLVLERHYDSACLIWTSKSGRSNYGGVDDSLSFKRFVNSFAGFIAGKMDDFEE